MGTLAINAWMTEMGIKGGEVAVTATINLMPSILLQFYRPCLPAQAYNLYPLPVNGRCNKKPAEAGLRMRGDERFDLAASFL